MKSVKFLNPFKPAYRPGRSVIQTNYDIVKAHGREIKVESIEKEGTIFIIQF